MDLSGEALLYVLIAVIAGAIIGYLLLRPRQRVRLSDSAPLRPHVGQQDSPKEGNGIISEAAAATTDVAGELISAPVHQHLGDGADNLQRMKGVGPKFAEMLQMRGFSRFEQLAGLSEAELARLDSDLGPFRGRLARDRIIEQAHYLARGDEDGFQEKFGKL